MQIIPAIDIIDGKCVRLCQGNYGTSKIYSSDPLDVARRFEDAGLRRLHLVDLDGAKSSSVVNIGILEKIARGTSLTVDFGGGVKTRGDLDRVFGAGAAMACVGSLAQSDPATVKEWLADYGPGALILGFDVWNGTVCINGWKKVTGTRLTDILREYSGLAANVMCTDISRDGMLTGSPVELYRELMTAFPGLNIIASGGVGSLADLEQLRDVGVGSVVVGKAIYENRIPLADIAAINEPRAACLRSV